MPAASVIVENVVAFEIAAAVVEKYVGTSLEAIKAAMAAMHELNRERLAHWDGDTESPPGPQRASLELRPAASLAGKVNRELEWDRGRCSWTSAVSFEVSGWLWFAEMLLWGGFVPFARKTWGAVESLSWR